MKGTITKQGKPNAFQPFEVTLCVESIAEARLLYHVFNNNKLLKHLKGEYISVPYNFSVYTEKVAESFEVEGLWANLKDELESQGFEI